MNIGIALGIPFSNYKKRNKVLFFDGVDDYADVPNAPSLNLTNEFTIEMWINPLSWSAAAATSFISKRSGSSATDGFFFGRLLTSGKLFVDVGGSSTRWNIDYIPPFNRWTHLAYTFINGVGTFYVNGEFLQTTVLGNITNTIVSLKIGYDVSPGYNFNGYLDEVRIWNVGRSATQIKNNMHARLRNILELIACYDMEGEDPSILTDVSGKGNNGNIFGAIKKEGRQL
jgi:hypothetical protein